MFGLGLRIEGAVALIPPNLDHLVEESLRWLSKTGIGSGIGGLDRPEFGYCSRRLSTT